MATRRQIWAAALLTLALAGCTSGTPGTDVQPSATDVRPSATDAPSATPSASPAATATPTTEEPDGDAEALPAGFPDPSGLIGQEAYDERTPDGSWRTVVGGQALDLDLLMSSCFDGGTPDVCGYAISASVPPGSELEPVPAEAALMLLLSSTGALADGTPTWLVVDAIVARPPDGVPAFLQPCEGTPGVAFYPAADAAPGTAGSPVPVAAAWGPDDAIGAIVEIGAATVTCAYVGE